MGKLDGRVYVVTGGSGALAEPIVRAFAQEGAHVVVAGSERSQNVVDARARAVRGSAVAAELTRPEGAETIVRYALDRGGRLDGVVHTVGAFAMAKLHESPPEMFDRMFDANVRTLFYVLRAAIPRLLARGDGFLAGISSEPGWTGRAPGSSLYGASKSAVASLLRSADAELAGSDVQVAAVYPMGAIDTAANRAAMPDADPTSWIDAGEIAEALIFAATRTARGRLLEIPIYPRRARRATRSEEEPPMKTAGER